jgi:hypothetical protein
VDVARLVHIDIAIANDFFEVLKSYG